MTALSAAAVAPAKALPVATPVQMAKIHDAAKSFEAMLVTQMLEPMFSGIKTDGPFGGGEGEGAYRGFMLDAFGKQMSKAGGIGVASTIQREMLKMQGLSEGPLA
jgi:Rod binding domain-containing protein